jgi:hypothetical protein
MIKYIQIGLVFITFVFAIDLKTEDVYDNSWALIVGINDYENVRGLNYAVEDALAIKNMLINVYGFPRNNVRVLTNGGATGSNIKKELHSLVKSVGENDRVVFYFAGHGETATLGIEGGDMGFLIPADGDAEDLYLTAIPMDELRRISNWSKAKHMLFLVDACYGGLAAMNTRSLTTNTPNYIDKITKDISRQIITAGGKDEQVLEKDEWEHSAFTKNLLSGLKEKRADYNDDGIITGSEIGMYLQEKVSLDTDNFQTPQIRRFTPHEGEIIFITKVEQKEEQEKELDYQQILQAMVLQMSQQAQNQNNQIPINDNQRVVKPGSIGLYAKDPTKDVMIESIFLRPSGLAYKGKFKLSIGASDNMSWSRVVIIEIDDVLEIPGETITGIYNYNTGTVD